MKIIEPFGASGEMNAILAAALPHSIFLLVGIVLLFNAKK
jgi:lipopolysaccharide export LptBFGC system permease protein LptF